MKGWTAIVPLNLGRDRKTRLAGRIRPDVREALVEAMAWHVLHSILMSASVSEIKILSPVRPDIRQADWLCDRGKGLNAELAHVFAAGRTCVIHADLPLLRPDDVAALVEAADRAGSAIASDRAGTGTNALAIVRAAPFHPAFGPDSLDRHRILLPDADHVRRAGLFTDVDTPDDLDAATFAGARPLQAFAARGLFGRLQEEDSATGQPAGEAWRRAISQNQREGLSS